jgi:hypothetical protein
MLLSILVLISTKFAGPDTDMLMLSSCPTYHWPICLTFHILSCGVYFIIPATKLKLVLIHFILLKYNKAIWSLNYGKTNSDLCLQKSFQAI